MDKKTDTTQRESVFEKANNVEAQTLYEWLMGYEFRRKSPCPVCGSRDNFTINPRTQKFHCFSPSDRCPVKEMSNVDFYAVLGGTSPKAAANAIVEHFYKDGGTPPTKDGQRARQPHQDEATTDPEVNALILQCLKDANGDKGLDAYLDARGITADLRRMYGIYTVNHDDKGAIMRALKSHFSYERLKNLSIVGEGRPKGEDGEARPSTDCLYFALYRHPIIYTLRDKDGVLAGFKGRAAPYDKKTLERYKYKNCAPQTGYNLQAAYHPHGDTVIFVEGEMDAIAAAALGYDAFSLGGLSSMTISNGKLLDILDTCDKNGVKMVVCADNDPDKYDEHGGITNNARDTENALNKAILARNKGVYWTYRDEYGKQMRPIVRYAAANLPNLTPAELDGVKDFGDILRRLNGDGMTAAHREECMKIAEKFTDEGTYSIEEIADVTDRYPFEIRRGFMDLIRYFNCYQYTFTDDFRQIRVEY